MTITNQIHQINPPASLVRREESLARPAYEQRLRACSGSVVTVAATIRSSVNRAPVILYNRPDSGLVNIAQPRGWDSFIIARHMRCVSAALLCEKLRRALVLNVRHKT